MKEVIYRNKINGTEISLSCIKDMLNKGNFNLRICLENIKPVSIYEELMNEKIKYVDYSVVGIPTCDDWELVLESDFSSSELGVLINALTKSRMIYEDSNTKELFDKIYKMYNKQYLKESDI